MSLLIIHTEYYKSIIRPLVRSSTLTITSQQLHLITLYIRYACFFTYLLWRHLAHIFCGFCSFGCGMFHLSFIFQFQFYSLTENKREQRIENKGK